ncbi:MAG: tRNA (N(6)-L-threonylcarbamoyladenosine(37)-C(2))-methylthiotransferase MtaB [Anaerovoracaceae bacterium]|jgi:threonylcarbamoyladenosine tRNA methylthiotransferase MtaB
MKIAFHTLGCKVNQYESEALAEQFEAAGHRIVDDDEYADVYVINTCTVTGLADRKSRQYIRRMKKINPASIVAVVGCYAQVSPDEVAALEGVNIVAGTNEKENLVRYVEAYGDGNTEIHIKAYEDLSCYESSGILTSTALRTRAYVKIQEGCDRFCSYCIIPYARGPVRSRNRDEVLEEARGLIEQGYKEIILTGINTALYEDLPGLLRDLDEMEGNFRVRLSSLEPTVVDEDFVREILKSRRLCHHLHLSLQSGSDRILKAMNRNYNRETYISITETLKAFDPLYGITTDIIVGFPGETEEDYRDSLDMISRVGFCRVHGFSYSKRKGTVAAKMKDQIPGPIKRERNRELLDLGQRVAGAFFTENVGTHNTVLFEEEEAGYLTGYTDNYIKAYLLPKGKGKEEFINQLVDVRIASLFRDGVLVHV